MMVDPRVEEVARAIYRLHPAIQSWDGDPYEFHENGAGYNRRDRSTRRPDWLITTKGRRKMAEDFDDAIQRIADGVKHAIGPFSGLLNPGSTGADKAKIDELSARVAQQDRLLNTQLDAISEKTAQLREVTLDRDHLREQLDAAARSGLREPEIDLNKRDLI